jgi:Na+(H+)/acetate symporter ActP
MSLSNDPTMVRAKRRLFHETIVWVVLVVGIVAVVFAVILGGDKVFGRLRPADYLLLLIAVLLWECLVELRNIRDAIRQPRDKDKV